MICTNTDHYVNTLSTIKKEKKKKTKKKKKKKTQTVWFPKFGYLVTLPLDKVTSIWSTLLFWLIDGSAICGGSGSEHGWIVS